MSRYSAIPSARSVVRAPLLKGGAMEAAAAAAKEQQRLQQVFLRAASMGLLADVEQLVAQGVSVAAVVRRAGGARPRRAADAPLADDRTRSAPGRCTWPRRATTPP